MAELNIISTFTSLTDLTMHNPNNPKIGDIVVSTDTYTLIGNPMNLNQSQLLALAVLGSFFRSSNPFDGSPWGWEGGETTFNGSPVTKSGANDDLRQYADVGTYKFDEMRKQLSFICYSDDDLSNAVNSMLSKVVNETFNLSIYKSTSVPDGYVDAYDIIKPYVSSIDQTLEGEQRSRSVDDGKKITFFSDKYILTERTY